VRRTLLPMLVVALLLGMAGACPAQDTALKPLVTVSFSGYDELFSDIDYIGGLANNEGMADGLEALLKLMTQGPMAAEDAPAVPGVDTKKPWGLLVQAADDSPGFPVLVFVPVTDMDALMGLVMNLAGGEADAPADGVWVIEDAGGQTLYAQEKGGWAFFVSDRAQLADVPADPAAALGGLEKKYDLAVKVSVANVPEAFRQEILSGLEEGAQMFMPGQPADNVLQQVKTMLNELNEIVIGWQIDQTTGSARLEVEVTAVAGTSLATQFSEIGDTKTNFAGFELPGAAVTLSAAGKLSDADVAQVKGTIAEIRTDAVKQLEDEGLSGAELALAKQVLTDLLAVAEKTIETKSADIGASVVLKPDAITIVAASAIAEGNKLEKVLKQVAGLAMDEEPEIAQMLKLDAGTHAGVKLHQLTVPVPPGEEEAAKMFGESLEVVVGLSDTSVYFALGRDATATLKQAIDASAAAPGKSIAPMRISISATPIAKFIAEMAPDMETKGMAGMLAAVLEQSGGKDHITITSKGIPNGSSTQVEIEGGLLKVIAAAAQMAQAAAGGGAGPPDAEGF